MSKQKDSLDKYLKWQPLLLAAALAVGILLGGLLNSHSPKIIFKERIVGQRSQVDKVSQVLKFIESQYVDTQNIDRLSEVAIEAILDELDPHSYYIDQQELADVNERTKGDFEGIGIEFIVVDDTLNVIRTVPNGPAENAGVIPGDQILMADGISIAGVPNLLDSIKQAIKGPAGTIARLLIKRSLGKDLEEVEVQRGHIPYHAVRYDHLFSEDIGYIQLHHFNGNAYSEFMESLESLAGEDEYLEHLIIDLRNNPGGYLQEVVKILSQLFKDKGKLMVYTNGRNAKKVEYTSTGMNYFAVGEIAVWVNEQSASASEILAGAIQDWERGIILGRRTFGKGLVQEQFELSDGSAIRLTTSRYHTPTGRLIQRPYDSVDYINYLDRRAENGELYIVDSMEILDTVSFKTPSGKAIKSGAGIIPDIFIPRDSFTNLPFVKSSYSHIAQYIYKDIRKERKANTLIRPDNLSDWWERTVFTDEKWQDWITYLDQKGEPTDLDLQWLPQVKEHLEAVYKFYYVNYAIGFEDAMEHDLKEDPFFKQSRAFFLSEEQVTELR